MKHGLLLLLLSFVLTSCGDYTSNEERDNAIHSAYLQLFKGDCDGALSTLNAAPQSARDPKLTQAKASAYGCKAGYSTVRFFGTDVTTLGSGASIFGDLSIMSSSALMTEVEDDNYENLQLAIDTLAYAGGFATTKQPTVAERQKYFDSASLGDIHAQLAYMIMVQLGMFLQYHGNTDALGTKGTGTDPSANTCLISYNDAAIVAAFGGGGPLNGNTGACATGALDGHSDLMTAGEANITRTCRALVNFNILFEILPEIVAALGDSDFSGPWQGIIDLSKDDLAAALALAGKPDDILYEYNETNCIDTYTGDDEMIEYFYAFIFEQLFL